MKLILMQNSERSSSSVAHDICRSYRFPFYSISHEGSVIAIAGSFCCKVAVDIMPFDISSHSLVRDWCLEEASIKYGKNDATQTEEFMWQASCSCWFYGVILHECSCAIQYEILF